MFPLHYAPMKKALTIVSAKFYFLFGKKDK